MAIIKTQDKEIQIADNTQVMSACDDLGVPFGCRHGMCGTCRTEVTEGMHNLHELNDAEKNMGLEGNERLMCQCRIKTGIVKIKV